MNGNRPRKYKHSHTGSKVEEWPEKMKLSVARKFLGISFSKMTALINTGIIQYERNPLDNRVKLVMRADLEELKRQFSYIQRHKEL
jgi:hypothetical protein